MKMLVVDDEPLVARFMAANLRKGGYTVAVATSGEEALSIRAADLAVVELTVMDVAMWPTTGPQVADAFRAINPGCASFSCPAAPA
jgi:CheY-like chemotaxis protein